MDSPPWGRNTETCVGALKEDTNFIEECVPCSSPRPTPRPIPFMGDYWEREEQRVKMGNGDMGERE